MTCIRIQGKVTDGKCSMGTSISRECISTQQAIHAVTRDHSSKLIYCKLQDMAAHASGSVITQQQDTPTY